MILKFLPTRYLSEECIKRVAASFGNRYNGQRPFIGAGNITDLGITKIKANPPGKKRPRPPRQPRIPHIPTTPPSGEKESTVIPATENTGNKKGTMKAARRDIPSPQWKPKDYFTAPWVFAKWEDGPFEVWLNEDHQVYKDELASANDKYLATAADVTRAVKTAFGMSAISKVAHVLHLKPTYTTVEGKSTNAIIDASLSEEALTTSLLGVHDVEISLNMMLRSKGTK